MKLVPAGVSKNTGKPYNAFYSCPNRCKQPKQDWAPPQVRQQFAPTVQNKEESIKVMHEAKQESIRWSVALNNACLLVANTKNPSIDVKEAVKDLSNFLYNLQPDKEIGYVPPPEELF